MGTVGVEKANQTIMGDSAMLKHVFVTRKFRLRRAQKRWKKEQKMKNCVLQKKIFFLSVFTSWKWFWGSLQVEKTA